jgi:hypothetical protein
MMDLDQFRKIYSDYRLAEARTKAAKYSAWDNNSQRFNIQPPQQKRELFTRKIDLVQRIPEVVRTVSLTNPLTKGITSKLAGVDNRDPSEKFLTYGDLFNFEAIPSDMAEMIREALVPLKTQIFIEGRTSIEQTQQSEGFTASIAVYNLVKNIIATLVTMRDGVVVDDRKRLRDGTNMLNTLVNEGMTAQTIPDNVKTIMSAVAGIVEKEVNNKLEQPIEDEESASSVTGGAEPPKQDPSSTATESSSTTPDMTAPVAPKPTIVDLTQNRTDTAADLHDQNVLNAANSTKASQALVPANQRDADTIHKVEKGDLTEALMIIRQLQEKLVKPEGQMEETEAAATSKAMSSSEGALPASGPSSSGLRTNPVDGSVIESESNVLAKKDEGQKAIEALRKALTEAKFKPDDPKSKASWRPPENWKYDEATKTWSFTAMPTTGTVPVVPGAATTATAAATAAPKTPEGVGPPTTSVQRSADLPITEATNPVLGDTPFRTNSGPAALPLATPSGNAALPTPNAQPAYNPQDDAYQLNPVEGTPIAEAWLDQIPSWSPLSIRQLLQATPDEIKTATTGGVDLSTAQSIFYITRQTERAATLAKIQHYLQVKGQVGLMRIENSTLLYKKAADESGTAINQKTTLRKELVDEINNAFVIPVPPAPTPQPPQAQLPAPVDQAAIPGGDGVIPGSNAAGKPKGKKRSLSAHLSSSSSTTGQVGSRKKRLDILTGSGFIPVVFGSENTQTTDKNLAEFGGEVVYDMKILRSPLPKYMDDALDMITGSEFSRLKQKYHFDQIFHLAVMVTTMKGSLLIEKNAHGINVSRYTPYPAEEMDVVSRRFGKPDFTVGSLIVNTQKALGDKFFTYSPFGNNCQNFIFNLLRSNGLMSIEYANFVSQDMTELLKELNVSNPQALPIINTVAGTLGYKQKYDDYVANLNNPNPNENPNPSVVQP